jgi:hypothetical protein
MKHGGGAILAHEPSLLQVLLQSQYLAKLVLATHPAVGSFHPLFSLLAHSADLSPAIGHRFSRLGIALDAFPGCDQVDTYRCPALERVPDRFH